MTNKELQDKYLGKRVEVPIDSRGWGSPTKTITGICKFIGHNSFFPSWEIQITVDRMPVPNIDISTIKILSHE